MDKQLKMPAKIGMPGILVPFPDGTVHPLSIPFVAPKEIQKHAFWKPYLKPILVETGTFYGHGVMAAIAMGCRDIHSIEIEDHLFRSVVLSMSMLGQHNTTQWKVESVQHKNFYSITFDRALRISLYCGDSCELLPMIMDRVDSTATIWLDGHYSGPKTGISEIGGKFPVFPELEILKKHPIKNHTIMIDDMITFEVYHPGKLSQLKSLLYSINENYILNEEAKEGEDYVLIAQEGDGP